jgi:hypothetical protein
LKTAVTTAPRNIELLDEDEPSAGAGEAIV